MDRLFYSTTNTKEIKVIDASVAEDYDWKPLRVSPKGFKNIILEMACDNHFSVIRLYGDYGDNKRNLWLDNAKTNRGWYARVINDCDWNAIQAIALKSVVYSDAYLVLLSDGRLLKWGDWGADKIQEKVVESLEKTN